MPEPVESTEIQGVQNPSEGTQDGATFEPSLDPGGGGEGTPQTQQTSPAVDPAELEELRRNNSELQRIREEQEQLRWQQEDARRRQELTAEDYQWQQEMSAKAAEAADLEEAALQPNIDPKDRRKFLTKAKKLNLEITESATERRLGPKFFQMAQRMQQEQEARFAQTYGAMLFPDKWAEVHRQVPDLQDIEHTSPITAELVQAGWDPKQAVALARRIVEADRKATGVSQEDIKKRRNAAADARRSGFMVAPSGGNIPSSGNRSVEKEQWWQESEESFYADRFGPRPKRRN